MMNDPRGMFTRISMVVLSWVWAGLIAAEAQVPNSISYQGRVTAYGTNFHGQGFFKFAFVNGSEPAVVTHWSNDGTSTAGSAPTSQVEVAVNTGLFTVMLGDTTLSNMLPIPPAVFGHAGLRLRIWFSDGAGSFQQLAPDQQLGSAGYAMFAANYPTGEIAAGTLTASNAIYTSGSVTASNYIGDGMFLTNVLDRLTGQRGLYRVWDRLRQGKGFNVLFIGDSLIAAGMNTLGNSGLRNDTLHFFGTNGAFGNAGGQGNIDPNFVTTVLPKADRLRWFGQYYTVTNGSQLMFFPNIGDAYCQADRISVPYLTKPGNGTLTIQSLTSTTTNTLAVIDTSLPTNSFFTNFAVANNRYRLRLEASGGDCDVIAPGMWQTNGTGVRWGWIGEGGVDNFETGYQYWTNALKAYEPDFVCFLQTGGDTNIAIPGGKAGWALFIRNTVGNLWPSADVVVSAIYPAAHPNTYAGQALVRENTLLREFCATYGWMYFDAYNLSPPWEVATVMPGWFMGDKVHYGPIYVTYLGGLLGKQLGWFDTPAASFYGASAATESPWANVPWARKGENSYFPATAVSAWPTAPRTPGEAFIGNSNGVIYILTSTPDSLIWSATNRLAP